MRIAVSASFVVLALASSLVLAACGAGATDSATDFEAEQALVAQAVERLEEESLAEDPAQICEEVLSRRLAQVIGAGDVGEGCASRIEQALDDADTFALTVESVKISDDTRATAEVRHRQDGENERVTVGLVKEGRTWRLDQLPAAPRS